MKIKEKFSEIWERIKYKASKYKFATSPLRITICSVLAILVILSLIFNNQVEVFLKFKPDINELNVNEDLEIHYVDVGQGDATLIRLPNSETILIDSGESSKEKILKTYLNKIFLKDNKIIDHFIITHSDIDHVGNSNFILDNYIVKNIYLPHSSILNLLDKDSASDNVYINIINKVNNINNNNINVHTNFQGLEIKDDKTNNTYIKWLSPSVECLDNTNDYSPILEITYKNKTTIITGDASTNSENICIANNDLKDVDVLKFGHHGSKNSTCLNFLNELNPDYGIISVGNNNVYDLPSDELLDRVYTYNQNLYNNIYRTDKDGNIIEHIDSEGNLNFYKFDNINSYSFVRWYPVAIVSLIYLLDRAMNIRLKKYKKIRRN